MQLVIGLVTLPYSWGHREEATTMIVLANYLQGIATFRPDAAMLVGIGLPYQLHMLLGMTIFLLLPLQPAGARVERLRHRGLPVPRAAGGALAPPERAGRPQHAAARH